MVLVNKNIWSENLSFTTKIKMIVITRIIIIIQNYLIINNHKIFSIIMISMTNILSVDMF